MYEANVEWTRKNPLNYTRRVLISGVYENFKTETALKIPIKLIAHELVMKCLRKVIAGTFAHPASHIILLLMNKFWKEHYANWGFVHNSSLLCTATIPQENTEENWTHMCTWCTHFKNLVGPKFEQLAASIRSPGMFKNSQIKSSDPP